MQDDPSNYTNRSPIPVLHLLREDILEKAIESYPDSEQIPEKNIQKTQTVGREVFDALLETIRSSQ